jgi:hypothetical protein
VVVHAFIPILRRLKQADLQLKASLGYIGSPVSKKRKRKRKMSWSSQYNFIKP